MASATSAAAPIKPFPLSPVQARRQGMPGNLTKEQEIALKKFQQQVSCEETETIRARGEAVEVLHLKWLQAVEVLLLVQPRHSHNHHNHHNHHYFLFSVFYFLLLLPSEKALTHFRPAALSLMWPRAWTCGRRTSSGALR